MLDTKIVGDYWVNITSAISTMMKNAYPIKQYGACGANDAGITRSYVISAEDWSEVSRRMTIMNDYLSGIDK